MEETDPKLATHFLMHGPGAAVASVLEGIGDGASFGLTQGVRQLMGTDCQVQKNGFYYGGLVVGIAATAVAGGALARGSIAAISNAGRLFNWASRAIPTVEDIRALVPVGTSLSAWGKVIWGVGEADARALVGARSAEELSAIPGLTREAATTLGNFYKSAALAGKGLPASLARVSLLDDIVNTLGG